jgi:hypothetical protein
MASYGDELLRVARRLLARHTGQRGRLSSGRVRRRISTTYYALFHFLLEEIGDRVVGTHNDLRRRRRILGRVVTHRGTRTTLDKVRGARVDASAVDFLRPPGSPIHDALETPAFVRTLANAFADAQAKRNDADYDLNKPLSEPDARLLNLRSRQAVAAWRAANAARDRDFKNALCLLILLKGQLRPEV